MSGMYYIISIEPPNDKSLAVTAQLTQGSHSYKWKGIKFEGELKMNEAHKLILAIYLYRL